MGLMAFISKESGSRLTLRLGRISMALSIVRLLLSRSQQKPTEEPSETAPVSVSTIRIAIYDSPASHPRITDVSNSSVAELIEKASETVHRECKGNGGNIPYTVIRELVENLMHSGFADSVISISCDGSCISFSDHGPGIDDSSRACLPGYTTATEDMRTTIRGVGSGLPIAKETMEVLGGSLRIDSNLKKGLVVSISLPREATAAEKEAASEGDVSESPPLEQREKQTEGSSAGKRVDPVTPEPSPQRQGERIINAEMVREIAQNSLSDRQKKLLVLAGQLGEIGPSVASKELELSLSTVHRDLVSLEELRLLKSTDSGKRKLTESGSQFLEFIFG